MNNIQKIIIFLIIFLFLIFQITLMPYFSLFNVFPNVLLALILCLGIIKNNRAVLLLAMAGGLMLDFFSSLPFGIYTVNFVLLVWLMQLIGRNILKITDLSGQILLIVIMCFIYSLFNILSVKIFHWLGLSLLSLSFWANFSKIGLREFIFNAFLTLITLFFVKKLYGLFAGNQRRA